MEWERCANISLSEQGLPKRTASPRRVLVVDDNMDVATSLAILLRRWDYDVQVAYDGWRAVEVACDYRPEVVLLDIGLPGLDGYEVAKRLRQEPWSEEIVLLAMTGSSFDPRRSMEAGFDCSLLKPIRPDVLRNLLALRH